MADNIKVRIDGREIDIEKGISLLKLSELYGNKESLIVAAKVDNHLRELNEKVNQNCTIEFIDLTNSDGNRIYRRSLSFVFIRAAMEILPGCHVTVEHSLSKGLYCEIHYKRAILDSDAQQIEARMKEIINEDVPLTKKSIPLEEAKKIFAELKMESKVRLLKFRESPNINIYECGWLKDYFYGYMVPSTGFLKLFKLQYYMPGVIIQFPEKSNPNVVPEFEEQSKLASIFRESEKWGHIMKIEYVANLNEIIEKKEYPELIRIAEGLHEKKIVEIADRIKDNNKRIILIAGPSSSGKTTFAQRLSIQLKVNGLRPIALSIDDYFVDRQHTPRDEEGNYDFESIDAVDIELFNKHLEILIQGEEVEIPTFNFLKGEREYKGKKLKITEDQPIIIEGIHGLNDKLTVEIPKEKKYKIYISALTQLNIDDHNRIPTTDSRLLRRIVRDSKHRGNDALKTLRQWNSVRKGEEKNIFPFQEEADIMFNSVLAYELAVIKKYAEPLLLEISDKEPEYVEAKRLLKFLNYFLSIEDDSSVPQTSIMKEFIGGSCFVE